MPIDGMLWSVREPWEGDTKIVIGIDIGATQSGVAFAFLQNGVSQAIHRVTKWPGQELHNQQSRIPTLVWYDKNTKAVAFGAEALSHTIEEEAEDNGWFLAKYFKLHLHPSDMLAKHEIKLDPLPPGVTLHQIYSDFLRYLRKHTRAFFRDYILDGRRVWGRYSPTMEVVITHPNGWGNREQAFLRSAAVAAGFSTAEQAPSKVRFVSEAEASVHFCIHHTNLGHDLHSGINFAVCQAGRSTVETTLYSVTLALPTLKLEKKSSVCIQTGGIFVDLEVEKFLHRTLTSAGLNADDVVEYTKAGVKDFKCNIKRGFRDEMNERFIQVANTRFHNPAIRTHRGCLTLSGSTIKHFFDVCVKDIIGSVDQQLMSLSSRYILLVGGFGDSPYLRQEFKKRYEPQGCRITWANDPMSKAVAEGAVIWRVAYELTSRVLQLSWGIETSVAFDYSDPDHQERKDTILTSDWTVVPGRWKSFANKGAILDRHCIVRISFSLDFPSFSAELGQFELSIYSYSGDGEPVWIKDKQGNLLQDFDKAATIGMNLEGLRGGLESRIVDGILRWQLDFNACMRFHGNFTEAYFEWEQEGIMRSGPCHIIDTTIG
ncbi:unnamed protein product [Rhizoctonia solani]|uniref:Heat shock 70 kDa protein 12A n=1 Tax=Rhizoctonia solani TaxID=456999 RepID=A0A8H3DM81_9AGAM|nr:unnamed protein product [Rhizoctonia solani]